MHHEKRRLLRERLSWNIVNSSLTADNRIKWNILSASNEDAEHKMHRMKCIEWNATNATYKMNWIEWNVKNYASNTNRTAFYSYLQ